MLQRKSIVAAMMTILVSFITFGVTTSLYVTHKIDQSERQICEIISLSTQPRPRPPVYPIDPSIQPETDFGRLIQEYAKQDEAYKKELESFNLTAGTALRNYSKSIGCPEVKK